MKEKTPEGFTLLEVLIALALLAGVVTTILVTFNRHLDVAVYDDFATKGMLLATNLISDPTFYRKTENSGIFPAPYQQFRWQRESFGTELPDVTGYRITVIWGEGSTRQVSLSTYVPTQD